VAWVTFPTLTDGQVLTGAHLQTVRDNFAETAPAKATATGKLIVTTGANTIAERTVGGNSITTSQGTTSVTYVNLATTGPEAGPLTTGAHSVAFASALTSQNTNSAYACFGVAVSNATTIAANDDHAFMFQPSTAATTSIRGTICVPFLGTLTPGLNRFTMQYRASAGTATFEDRTLTVFAL
jgi:hypothetical protein